MSFLEIKNVSRNESRDVCLNIRGTTLLAQIYMSLFPITLGMRRRLLLVQRASPKCGSSIVCLLGLHSVLTRWKHCINYSLVLRLIIILH